MDSKRLAWIRRLIALGTRTEQDIIEASDNCLADWVQSDEGRQARTKNRQPQPDLDSTELTEMDLNDEEVECYIRSKPDQEAVQRVMHKAHLEFEQVAKLAAARRYAKESLKKAQLQRKRIRQGLPPDKDWLSGGGMRKRSRKLRLEALGDSDNEFDTATRNLPRPGQLVVHQAPDPSTDKEAKGQGEEVYDDGDAEDEVGYDDVGYGVGYDDDGYEYDFDYGSD
jgi:hypothetical protein